MFKVEIMKKFQFADLHCHPTLKTYGYSHARSMRKKLTRSDVWFRKPPTFLLKCLQKVLGITRFSQADFTTLASANVKVAFVSFYPFEKGFFLTPRINNKVSARLANYVTSIGYDRVRHLQMHTNYFEDFINEYNFFCRSAKHSYVNGVPFKWNFIDEQESESNLLSENCITVIPTIEGTHIVNSGLTEYGVPLDEERILRNVQKLKRLKHPPFFITFAHNFNNDLCGHAPSLEPLKGIVDQSKNLNAGFTPLGIRVLHSLLNDGNGRRIFIDIKHMSLKSRYKYYRILEKEYDNSIPIIVSHGAVTGRSLSGKNMSSVNSGFYANDSINFYDEEIVNIAKSNGLFAIQLDAKRLAPKKIIKKSVFRNNKKEAMRSSSLIVWRQLQHIAEILDAQGLSAWEVCCIGSDFDGTIDPLEGVWTANDLNNLANALLLHAADYLLQPNALKLECNASITPEVLVENFVWKNTINFLKKNYPIKTGRKLKVRTIVRDYV